MAASKRGNRGADKKPRRFWTEAELAYIREHYACTATKTIAEALGRTVLSIYQGADKLGLSKDPIWLKANVGLQKGSGVGAAFRYPKGHVPANKGLRRPGDSPGRMRETQFKKGSRTGKAAINYRPVGTVLPDHEGFVRVKLRDAHGEKPFGFANKSVWQLVHHKVWIEHNGPIPPKHIVTFKDRNRNNCAIENLELITMAENARRNRMWTIYPREFAEAIHLNGQLKRRIRNRDAKEHDYRSQEPSLRNDRSPEGSGQADGSLASAGHN